MSLPDVSFGELLNGFCGLTALYLAFQIKFKLADHERRLMALELAKPAPKRKRRL